MNSRVMTVPCAMVLAMMAGTALPVPSALAQMPGMDKLVDSAKDAAKSKLEQEKADAAKKAQAEAEKLLKKAGMEKKAEPAPETAQRLVKQGALSPAELAQPLPMDPRLVTGTLDNGLSYMVMKHSNPPGRANMYIHVSSGSLNETDKQRGIAHYLEHMAFNGSENFKPGTVVDFFQSMGLTFGQHQNAFTSFDQTTYILSFPDNKPETVERGMRFFGDVSSRLLLAEDEINNERQVILEEKRTRISAAQRMQDYVLERLFPGSLIGSRLPIGTEETLLALKRDDFQDYYSKWYVPSNMTVLVVADGEPSDMVAQITKAFSGGEKRPKPVDNDPRVKPYDSTRAIVAHDKEQKRAEVSIAMVGSKESPITTVGDMRRDLVKELGVSIFNRRIGAQLAKGGTSYVGGQAFAQNLFSAASLKQVGVEGEPAKWKDMLKELGTELQRARLHGFTQRELDDVAGEMIAGAERQVEQSSTMRADTLVRVINNSIATGDTMVGPQQELELYKRVLPTISVSEISAAFASNFDTTHVTFLAELPSDVPGGLPSESELVELGRKALDVKPEAEKEKARPTSLMTSLPTPGKMGEITEHAGSSVVSGWLSNGIRVHYRFMDYKKDTAWVAVNFAAGTIQETAETRGTAEVAALAGATSTMSSTDLRDLMTGKKVSVNGNAGGDTFGMVISGNPGELETGMQLAHLMITDPVIEASAFDRWKTNTLQAIELRSSDIQAAMGLEVARTLYPESEARVQPLSKAQVEAMSRDKAQAWLTKTMTTAPAEVTIVGDISKERAMQLAETYLGSLPMRERISASTLDNIRTIKRPVGPIARVVDLKTITPKSMVLQGFYGPDAENVQDTMKMQMATRIVDTRMFKKIREQEQLAYSPGCRVQPGVTYPGFGIIVTASPTDPAKAQRLTEANKEIFDEFAAQGPTAEEVDVAKKQIANTLDETMKEPSFWLGRTATMTYRNVNLDDVVSAASFYQKLEPKDIKEVFAKYYSPATSMQLIIRPAADAKGAAAPTPEAGKVGG